MEVGVAPGDVVLDRDSAPSTERGTAAVHFSANFGGNCSGTVTNLSNC